MINKLVDKIKKTNGITLVALIVTIIVLLCISCSFVFADGDVHTQNYGI